MVVGSIIGAGAKMAGKGLASGGKAGASYWKAADTNAREWITYLGNVAGSYLPIFGNAFAFRQGAVLSATKAAEDFLINSISGRERYENERNREIRRAEQDAESARDAELRAVRDDYRNRRITATERAAETRRINTEYQREVDDARDALPPFEYSQPARIAYAVTSAAKAGALAGFGLPHAYKIIYNLSETGPLSFAGPLWVDLIAALAQGALLWYGGKSAYRSARIATTGRE